MTNNGRNRRVSHIIKSNENKRSGNMSFTQPIILSYKLQYDKIYFFAILFLKVFFKNS